VITRSTAEPLAQAFTVFNLDRRGRGDSGDTLPFDVGREIEDIGALIGAAGGTAVLSELLDHITVPVLTISGGVSPPFMIDTGVRLAAGVADGRHHVLEGEGHEADPGRSLRHHAVRRHPT